MALFEPMEDAVPVNVTPLVQGNTRFALDLYHQLSSTGGNLFFSPYSISTALGMTCAGARGRTESQIVQTLHFPLQSALLHPAFGALEEYLHKVGKRGGIQLKIANALWPQQGYPLLAEYLNLVEANYGVAITSVDYGNPEEARQMINSWVETKTDHKIKDLIALGLPPILTPLTTLVLTNAIYFKGDWARQFDKRRTVKAPFWIAAGESVPAPMMSQEAEFAYLDTHGVRLLELPYIGDQLSMIILLPEGVKDLAKLEQSLTMENLELWIRSLAPQQVQLSLPRFELTCPFRLDQVLKTLGMVDAFSSADFSGIDGTKSLVISAVLHKAFVAVGEEGTEAAAATAVIMDRSLPSPPVVFRADHPFIFLIRHKASGSILFIGRVMRPS